MSPLRAVIFDKDGTLFDFRRSWERWAQRCLARLQTDATPAKVLGHAIGFDVRTGMFAPDSIVIAGTPAEVTVRLKTLLPEHSGQTILDVLNDEAENAPQVEAAPLLPILGTLRDASLALGVATNDAEFPARAHLEAAGIAHCFDFIAGFDSGYGAKPDPGQLLAFAEAVALDPREILMVGDSLHDLHAARAAGMRAVAVLTGVAEAGSLAAFAEVVLPDIGHLPEWLKSKKLIID